jgi:hypothetical protein
MTAGNNDEGQPTRASCSCTRDPLADCHPNCGLPRNR